VLPEPREKLGMPSAASTSEGFLATLKILWHKPSYRYTLVGLTIYGMFSYGALIFAAAFLIRVLGVDIARVGTAYGAVSAVGAVVGTLAGGYISDKLVARDPAWLLRLPAIGLFLSFPLYLASFLVWDFTAFLLLSGVGGVLLTAALPSIFAGTHAVCGSARRAMSVAVLLFFLALVGGTLGPLITGVISDLLKPAYGVNSLAHALAAMTTLMLVCAWAFHRASLTLVKDMEA
jgi:MFS family permease